jgi:chromosomal replication initiator protein
MVKKYGLSTRKVGEIFNKTHPSVINSVKVVEEKMKNEKDFELLLKAVEKELQKSVGKAYS